VGHRVEMFKPASRCPPYGEYHVLGEERGMVYAPTAPRQPTRSQESPSSDYRLNTWRVCPLQALRKLVAVRIYERSKNAAEPGLADRARQALAEVDLTEQDVEEMYKLFATTWRDRFVIHTNPRRCAN